MTRTRRPADPATAPPLFRGAQCDLAEVVTMRAGRQAVDASTRAELLQAVKDGREVELEIDIVAFTQTEQPNKNFVRATPAFARKLARSLAGKPFIRDHDHGNLDAAGGEVLSSTWEGQEGVGQIKQTVRLTYPWAVEHALRGGLKRFSIAWTSQERPTCSIDGQKMGFFEGCGHWPGDEVTLKDGTKARAEAVFSDGEGIETSGVLIPATDTSLEAVRASLAAFAEQEQAAERVRAAIHHEEKPMKTIATMLGLAEAANEATIAEAVGRLKTEHATLAAANEQAKTALAAAQAELAKVAAEAGAAKLEALVEGCYRDGKIAGEKGKNDLEKGIREMAALSFAGAEAFVKAMPKVVPVGAPVSLETRSVRTGETVLTAQQKRMAKGAGVSEEDYLKQLRLREESREGA